MYGEGIPPPALDPYGDGFAGGPPNGAAPNSNPAQSSDSAPNGQPPSGPTSAPSGTAPPPNMRPRSRSGSRGRDRSRSRSPKRGASPGAGYRRRSPPRRANPASPTASSVLGVFGLSIRTQERDLEDEFSRYGRVEKVTIVYDQRSDRSRGFGFIKMSTVEEATRCIQALNQTDLNGRRIRVDYSLTERPHAPTPGEYMGHRRSRGYDRGVERGGYERGFDRERERFKDRDYYGRDNREYRRSPPRARYSPSPPPPPRRRSYSRSPEPRRDYDGPSGAAKPRW